MRHPTIGVALFEYKSLWPIELLKRATIRQYNIFTGTFVLGLAHRNVGRVAQTNIFEAMFREIY